MFYSIFQCLTHNNQIEDSKNVFMEILPKSELSYLKN